MEQEPTPLIEIFELIIYLGSVTFLLGGIFQAVILYRNRRSFMTGFSIILATRILTVISSYLVWSIWILPFDVMFLFFLLPALISEVILSPLILKVFGNELFLSVHINR